MTDESTAGKFLVATPLVGGLPFDRSVVLMLEHNDGGGAIGLVLNAATDILIEDHIPDLTHLASEPPVIHVGGPVDTDTAIVLIRSGTATFLRPTELGNIGIADPAGLPHDLNALRVFAGYAGWDAGQLEEELEEGAWWVLPADRSAIFSPDTSHLWEETIARAPGTIPFHQTFTRDVGSN